MTVWNPEQELKSVLRKAEDEVQEKTSKVPNTYVYLSASIEPVW